MTTWHRLSVVGGVAALLLLVLARSDRGAAQPNELDSERSKMLDAAQDYIAERIWETALETLQKILKYPEDKQAELRVKVADGKWQAIRVSAHDEAERMILNLPPEGRAFYQEKYGPAAAELLKKALEKKDVGKLHQVVRWYLYTPSGPEALLALARHFQPDRPFMAARHYKELLNHRGAAQWSADDLYHASLVFRAAQEQDPSALTEKWLRTFFRAGRLQLGNRVLTAAELDKELERAADPGANGFWPMVGGDATRSAQATGGGAPFLEPRWRQSLLLRSDRDSTSTKTQNWLAQADNFLQRRQVVIPASQPITVAINQRGVARLLVLCRTYSGVEAIDLTTGKIAFDMQSKWGLENMASSSGKMSALNSWLDYYVQQKQRPSIVYENSTIGTLSTDGRYVFAVEDLAVPPPQLMVKPGFPGGGNPNFGNDELNKAVQCSELQAFELATNGKLKWSVGGAYKDAPLGNSYFLGPPLPYKGSLYVLLETTSPLPSCVAVLCPLLPLLPGGLDWPELRVARLDPNTGRVLANLAIHRPRDRMQIDIYRRIAAAQLAAADGILVVPTNAGNIVGVDLTTDKVVWSAPYGGEEAKETNRTSWRVTPPVIHDGKVVFAAPDSDELHCLNLKDGSSAWKVKRADDDLYLAGVYTDRVMVVGKRQVKAYTLAKGENAWEVETGEPSGFGMASDNVYYLPLRQSAASKEPEVCAIDVAKGKIVAHAKAREKNGKRDVPGTLVFVDGQVLSMTATELVAYPQLKAMLKEIGESLKKNPNDPQALTERGEQHLANGDLQEAVEDLRKALENKPRPDLAARARNLLYEALTEYLRRDFNKAEPYLKEYEALGKIDKEGMTGAEKEQAVAEEKRRRTTYLIVTAKGREEQGKYREALQLYFKLGESGDDGDLMPSLQEPALKVNHQVWVRQRIAEMLKNAPADKAKELQDEIDKKWKDLQGAKD